MMKSFTIQIETLSPLHLGSGQENIVLDADVVYDQYGMPYFPARRFRGLLYESAMEMEEMSQADPIISHSRLVALFGHQDETASQLRISNFYLGKPDQPGNTYEQLCQQWQYLQAAYPGIFTGEDILAEYTDMRYQTAIDFDSGTILEGSLHNMRVVWEGTTFFGTVEMESENPDNDLIFLLALKNLCHAGAKRNRGLGRIRCSIIGQEQGHMQNLWKKIRERGTIV